MIGVNSKVRPGANRLILLGAALLLAGCAESTPALSIGESASLTSDSIDASLTVTGIEASDFDSLGLEGLFGSDLPDGVPWVVDYRIDMNAGTRPDFSWDAVPTLTSTAWTAETDNGSDVAATSVQSSTSEWCPGYESELADEVVGTYCHVFIVPEGRELTSVEVADVATWTTAG